MGYQYGLAYLYVLRDPETGAPRYVGRTKDPGRRRGEHRTKPTRIKNVRLREWLLSLRGRSLAPRFEPLAAINSIGAHRTERAVIRACVDAGFDLLNEDVRPEPDEGARIPARRILAHLTGYVVSDEPEYRVLDRRDGGDA